MWRDVELRELRIFLVLAGELHFGRTAERIRISQPGVSEAVRILESRLGVRLFDRTSRRVRLTPAGEELRRKLAPALAALEQALAETSHPPRGQQRVVRRVDNPHFTHPLCVDVRNVIDQLDNRITDIWHSPSLPLAVLSESFTTTLR